MTTKNFIKTGILTSKSFLEAVSPSDRDEAYAQYISGSFTRIVLISLVMALVSVVSLIRDLAVGFYFRPSEPFNYLNAISFSMFILLALAIVVIRFYAKGRQNAIRVYEYAHQLFLMMSSTALLLFLFTEFARGRFLCFQMFYLMFYSAVPSFRLRNNIFNCLFLFSIASVEYILAQLITPTTESIVTNLIYFLLIVFGCFAFGLYLRHFYLYTIIGKFEILELNHQLKIKSEVDQLTGCLNRYALTEAFSDYRAAHARVAVMMLDVDDFKAYNDSFSHIKGDECLQRLSKAIRNVCGGYKFDVYRYGGEEFLLLGSADNGDYMDMARDMMSEIASLKMTAPDSVGYPYVSVSIGIFIAELHDKSQLPPIIEAADKQVYLAKKSGKACAYFNSQKVINSTVS